MQVYASNWQDAVLVKAACGKERISPLNRTTTPRARTKTKQNTDTQLWTVSEHIKRYRQQNERLRAKKRDFVSILEGFLCFCVVLGKVAKRTFNKWWKRLLCGSKKEKQQHTCNTRASCWWFGRISVELVAAGSSIDAPYNTSPLWTCYESGYQTFWLMTT